MSFNPFTLASDPFDSMLNKVCSIWKKGETGQIDSYGIPIQQYFQLVDDVPCFVQALTGKELNTPPAATSQTSYGVQTFRVYMRPISVDIPAVPLNIKHWLQIKEVGQIDTDPNDKTAGAVMHNITFVEDIGRLGHHLEVETTIIEA